MKMWEIEIQLIHKSFSSLLCVTTEPDYWNTADLNIGCIL